MKKTIILSTILVASAALCLDARDAGADEIPLPVAPEWVEIEDIFVGGSGCPEGSVQAVLSPDRTSVTLTYDTFDAAVGPDVDPKRSNNFCNATIIFDYPTGWSYSLISADYMGVANLDPGVLGRQSSTYWFQGYATKRHTFSTNLIGPHVGKEYFRRDKLTTEAVVWSPCGAQRALNVNSNVSVSNVLNPRASGHMNVQVTETTVQVTYGLTWRQCH